MRLWLSYPAILLTAVGLIVWGISVDKKYHWIVGQVAFTLRRLKPCFERQTLRLMNKW